MVRQAIDTAERDLALGFTDHAQAAVRGLLMGGDASAARVAEALRLHERRLRRRLLAGGTSLHRLLALARFDVARQLLRETQLALQDIAEVLGYADAAVFVRAFRGWAGITPGQWRARVARVSDRP